MPTVADYQVLRDGQFRMNAADTTRMVGGMFFTVPTNLVHGTNKAKLILAFKMRPIEDMAFKVRINDREIIDVALPKGNTTAYWETFPETFLGTGHSSNVEVEYSLQKGRAAFSDVVLWYQVKVD